MNSLLRLSCKQSSRLLLSTICKRKDTNVIFCPLYSTTPSAMSTTTVKELDLCEGNKEEETLLGEGPLHGTSEGAPSLPSEYKAGDLVEVNIRRNMYLGFVKSDTSLDCPWMIQVVFYNGIQRFIMTHTVRFHHSGFVHRDSQFGLNSVKDLDHAHKVNCAIKAFEKGSMHILDSNIEKLDALMDQLISDPFRPGRPRTDNEAHICKRFWTVDEISREIFGLDTSQITIAEKHAIHRYLFFNTLYLIKPPYVGKNGPYYLREHSELMLLKKVSELTGIALTPSQVYIDSSLRNGLVVGFRSKLQKIIKDFSAHVDRESSAPKADEGHNIEKPAPFVLPEFTPSELLLVEAMRHYACSHAYNLTNNPYFKYVNLWMANILNDKSNSEVFRFLTRTNLLPPNFNFHPYQSGLSLTHSHLVMEEASHMVAQLEEDRKRATSGKDYTFADQTTNRKDFGDMLSISIDSDDTTEVDDAISYELLSDGTEWIHVHIADPSSIIQRKCMVDIDIQEKNSTIYCPDKHYRMLPQPLVDGISLKTGRPNLTLTHSFQLDAHGDISDYRIQASMVHHIQRLNYEQADAMIRNDNANEQLAQDSRTLNKLLALAKRHRTYRFSKGAIQLDMPEPSVKLDRNHSPLFVKNETDLTSPSKYLISELMIVSGRVAALWASERALLIPYRGQEPPKSRVPYQMIEDNMGYFKKADLSANNDLLSSHDYLIKGSQLKQYMNRSSLDIAPVSHWSMGLASYARTTSPMRRYADLLVHYQIKSALLSGRPGAPNPLSREALARSMEYSTSAESKIKSLQRRSLRFWVLSWLCKNPTDKVYSAFVVNAMPDARSFQIFVRDVHLSFYLKNTKSIKLEPGSEIKLVVKNVDVQSTTVQWNIIS